ncbi:helix-turn-helix domain-containing protein [Streptomyces sp. NPDC005962]|uniref:helix-turn-helix domain-containing protein n=1 Tax=Streptomyces sp. NPDC005962 TaxID=3154466 RepID=UPI0033C37388
MRVADSEPWDQLIDRASGRLDSMVERFLAKVMTEPAYTVSALTAEDLRHRSVQTFTAMLESLRTDGDTTTLRGLSESLGTLRARQAIPLDSLLRVIRLDFTILWETLADPALEANPALLVRNAGRVWATVDTFVSDVQEHYLTEQAAIELANADLQRTYLSQLFASTPPSEASLERIAGALRIRTSDNFCVAATSKVDGLTAQRRLRSSARRGDVLFTCDRGHHTLFIWPTTATALGEIPPAVKGLFEGMAVAIAPVARGLESVREAATAAREIMTDLPMGSSGIATLLERWKSVTKHQLSQAGCDLGQLVFPYLRMCTPLEREKILTTVTAYVETGSLSDTSRSLRCHRNTVLNRLNAFQKYTGLDVQRPYDAAAVILALP